MSVRSEPYYCSMYQVRVHTPVMSEPQLYTPPFSYMYIIGTMSCMCCAYTCSKSFTDIHSHSYIHRDVLLQKGVPPEKKAKSSPIQGTNFLLYVCISAPHMHTRYMYMHKNGSFIIKCSYHCKVLQAHITHVNTCTH